MSESQVESSAPEPKKRKATETRSQVWDHFEKNLSSEGNLIKGMCKYCKKTYAADPKKYGTSSLKNHSIACLMNPQAKETRQSRLAFGRGESNESVLTNWVFNQDNVRREVTKMIVIDELPFKFVEGRGFRGMMQAACPMFKIPSRWTVNRDIFAIYLEERKSLKKFFKEHSQRVSLTTDTWTSVQRINYMCITAHYIDAQWKLNKKIISFVPIQSHKGDAIAKALEVCLVEWGIRNIMTITVDNASSNDVALVFLKSKLVSWGCSSVRAQYLHMRCIAHILNLVVQDGLKMADSALKKLRDTVRNAIPYRYVFEAYDGHEPSFKLDLGDSLLADYDWVYLESFINLLKNFYEMTIRISGSLYVTSNSYLTEICDLGFSLTEMIASPNLTEKNMDQKMKDKFDKYWGDEEKMNLVIFFANIMDPRDKMEYMPLQFDQLFGAEKGEACFRKVKSQLTTLFEDNVQQYSEPSQSQSQSQSGKGEALLVRSQSKFKSLLRQQKLDSGALDGKTSELDVYLGEAIVDDNGKEFDLLMWWKLNSARFPILSKLASDVLAVPISTVASESTFSTGGRVLDNFRSSLTPKIVEALICTQDWLRGPSEPIAVEENLEDLEKFEKEIDNLRVGTSSTRHEENIHSVGTQASDFGGFEEVDTDVDP
ncbi:hypothetical protein L6452_01846 [Arctium lappa]|uniref:Uncharacterized protein n=1 Tax=Arctium lappa TaxID=4217 RepID=A0ACB9FIL3_ARCLA|nr:hypothetical protein L6452_01846 [Arctium lappa]